MDQKSWEYNIYGRVDLTWYKKEILLFLWFLKILCQYFSNSTIGQNVFASTQTFGLHLITAIVQNLSLYF